MRRHSPEDKSVGELVNFINSGGLSRHPIFTTPEPPEANEEAKPAQPTAADDTNVPSLQTPTTQTSGGVKESDCERYSGISQGDGQDRGSSTKDKGQETLLATEQDTFRPNLPPTRTEGFDFRDPVELLFLLDDAISLGKANGGIDLHKWQIQFMVDFAAGGFDHEHPFHALVRAANGSGKDKYIIAACAVWLCMVNIRANCIVTSSSGSQLDKQTCRHITDLCDAANRKIDPSIWKINYRRYACLATGGKIDCFATDEPGKAEGFHPIDFGRKMALFMSEAKTVPDDINGAYDRCDGYTHRVHVSSPGTVQGHFYDDCLTATPRNSITKVTDIDPSLWIHYLITAYDCSHISKVRIKKLIDKYGLEDPLVQSSIFAEFSTFGERVIIPFNFVQQCVEQGEWIKEPFNKAGLDLSDGGDETVLVVRNGNKVLNICPFRLDNSDDTFTRVKELFEDNDLNHPECIVNADCGGIGKPTLDRLVRAGWTNIRYIDNRAAARDKRAFYKCATEYWWHCRELLQRKEIILTKDKNLNKQLAGRYYKLRDGVLRHLLSKAEQKSKGYNSPDRADSLVLAFLNYKSTWTGVTIGETTRPFKVPPEPLPSSDFTFREYVSRGTTTYNKNPSFGKDFSLLREDIEMHNKQRLTLKI